MEKCLTKRAHCHVINRVPPASSGWTLKPEVASYSDTATNPGRYLLQEMDSPCCSLNALQHPEFLAVNCTMYCTMHGLYRVVSLSIQSSREFRAQAASRFLGPH